MSIEKKFKRASKRILSLDERPDDNTMLRLYSLYKQATEGDATGRLPIAKGMVAVAKWKSWKKLEGTDPEDAMASYCEIADVLLNENLVEVVQEIESWRGRTVLITGASRGLGRAMAIRLGEEGANVILCARSMEANEKLPGTLPETKALVEAAGGKAICAQMDVRVDEQVQAAVEKGAAAFNGIDAVICNAGALFIAPFAETPMKRFDLVHEVNSRGTFSLCQAALPHLMKSDAGRILVLAPPIALDPKWLNGTLAYTLSKYSMSMLVLGLSGELAMDGIAVNAIWPATTIDTAAVRYNEALGGEEMVRRSRKPRIVADAALHILSQNKTVTGQFYTDESALMESGVDDFEKYAVEPGMPLQSDFYL
ncbi:MAG: acyl-CoA-binding protein [Candidatus Thalassarchaeaceae archaeon]|nr:acyl-CoA-binding protein [Candidatus Thalassarchaeaceae archaeon]